MRSREDAPADPASTGARAIFADLIVARNSISSSRQFIPD
jgi:hypothetical protein